MGKDPKVERKLKKIYGLLEKEFGDLGWWPAESGFEVIAGAVLTQNTSWKNVEKAIKALKRDGSLGVNEIISMRAPRLSRLIRSAGYHRVKARRLKNISRFVADECGGRLGKLKKRDVGRLREALLEVNGIGPETADSILLYALDKPVFVVDAYTRRIFARHGLNPESAAYDEVQAFVHEHFPCDAAKLKQFHALLVEAAKAFCKKKRGHCGRCPLKNT